jgi:hypothetical protein
MGFFSRNPPPRPTSTIAPAEAALRTAVRKLWADHVIWTRQYIVAAVAGTPDASAAATRLLANQDDIGQSIVPFYGPAGGEGLTKLLKEHILIAVDLVAAAKTGDTPAFQRHDARWSQNATAIANFLAAANPNWPAKEVNELLELHLKLTKGEAVARLKGNWADDVKAFDEIFAEAMTIADALSTGIVRQFPDRFAN